MKNIIIIGGGLAGLISAIQFARRGIFCTVVEKKSYPFHRVCGEYISNEVVPFLEKLDLFPHQFAPPRIHQFQLSATNGRSAILPLDCGGFGISRYTFDHFLYVKARELDVNFLLNTEAEEVNFCGDKFFVKTSSGVLESDLVIGSFGKRSKLDHFLRRDFVSRHSPYVGIKYHIRMEHPDNLIALHNFSGGYCGVSNVENGFTNLCYLVHRDSLRKSGSIDALEKTVLCKNPQLKNIFENADFIFQKPETINEISFETKDAVHDHILMAGDAAGMITPLCGNGMAMAIRAAKLTTDLAIQFCQGSCSREQLEKEYETQWKKLFARRLWAGRKIQTLFGSETASAIAINLALHFKPLANFFVRNTHGKPFQS